MLVRVFGQLVVNRIFLPAVDLAELERLRGREVSAGKMVKNGCNSQPHQLGFSASSTPQIVLDELLHNGLDHRALGGYLSAVRQVVDLLKSSLERCLI